jgi:hypothetical protein
MKCHTTDTYLQRCDWLRGTSGIRLHHDSRLRGRDRGRRGKRLRPLWRIYLNSWAERQVATDMLAARPHGRLSKRLLDDCPEIVAAMIHNRFNEAHRSDPASLSQASIATSLEAAFRHQARCRNRLAEGRR